MTLTPNWGKYGPHLYFLNKELHTEVNFLEISKF